MNKPVALLQETQKTNTPVQSDESLRPEAPHQGCKQAMERQLTKLPRRKTHTVDSICQAK